MVALPVVPVHPVAEALVLAPQVEAVQVGVVAGAVPPGPLESETQNDDPNTVIGGYSISIVNCSW